MPSRVEFILKLVLLFSLVAMFQPTPEACDSSVMAASRPTSWVLRLFWLKRVAPF
jgi:hypothetical protein